MEIAMLMGILMRDKLKEFMPSSVIASPAQAGRGNLSINKCEGLLRRLAPRNDSRALFRNSRYTAICFS